MSSERMQDWVCKALEMEEKGREFYDRVAQECSDSVGKEVFAMLRDDEVRHKRRIKEISEALESGSDWQNACRLQEDFGDAHQVFSRVVSGSAAQSCGDRPQALDTGIEFELALVDFYERALRDAEDSVEKEFLEKMVQEEKGHYILLSDMSYYYEDPEAWARDQGRGGLDGA